MGECSQLADAGPRRRAATVIAPALFDFGGIVLRRLRRELVPQNEPLAGATGGGGDRHADAVPLLPAAVVGNGSDDLGQVEFALRELSARLRTALRTEHIWTIGELVDAALEGVLPAPGGRRYGRFTVIDGGRT